MGPCLSGPDRRHSKNLDLSAAVVQPDPRETQTSQSLHTTVTDDSNRFLVIAIDFGTTYTGYAFSFRHEYKRDRLKISTNLWTHSTGLSVKAPTAVLLDNDLKLVSFGYDALRDYADLAESGQHTEYFLYNRFKMSLYTDENLRSQTMLADVRGKQVPAITVFSALIGYLKNHAIDRIQGSDSELNLTGKHVHWVITVPAIWHDKAKQFMRMAAQNAGIEADRLTLALEPEAASLYCRDMPVYRRDDVKQAGADKSFVNFGPGTKYMILDLGGGTVDVTLHIIREDGALQELCQPSGGYWGGTNVDSEFSKLVLRIFGETVMMRAHCEYPQEMLEFMTEFEVKKRVFRIGQTTNIQIKIPACLSELYSDVIGVPLAHGLASSDFKDTISVKRGKLVITAQLFEGLFATSLSYISGHILQLLHSGPAADVETILLVGGYSESPVVKEHIGKVFSHLRIISPDDASLVVLKGAVLFGHEPRAIASRVCRNTYGIAMYVPFDPANHPPHTLTTVNGLDYCEDVFDVHLRVGDTTTVGDVREEKPYYIAKGDVYGMLDVYVTSQRSPQFVFEPGCTKLGTVTIEVESANQDHAVKVMIRLLYQGTELGVEAREVSTGKLTKAHFDFLG